MNKIATYLNEHLAGEVLTDTTSLRSVESDGSVLARRAEMVVRVLSINDIRKIMRFCSQLAEKGHVVPVSVRGSGTDTTGGATSGGIVIDMNYYLHHVAGLDAKQQLMHVQAGISHAAANATLSTHKGLGLANISVTGEDGTVGGAIGAGAVGAGTFLKGTLGAAVEQLEVVLSNGEVLQTGRITKRELERRKGLATFEGEIYRQIDNIITDNLEAINRIDSDASETTGFSNITKVRAKDGSFDLTPLFVGSQGALGVIGEAIIKAEFVRPESTVVIAAYSSMADAQHAGDAALASKASRVELIDGRILARAAEAGKVPEWAPKKSHEGAVLIVVFDDFTQRTRQRAAKKLMKKLESTNPLSSSVRELETALLPQLYAPLVLAKHSLDGKEASPAVFSGTWLPMIQLDGFLKEITQLEIEHKLPMPVYVDMLSGYVDMFPLFSTTKVSDRQKILKVIADLAKIVPEHNGSFAGRGGDGRLKAGFIQKYMDEQEKQVHQKIKDVFDPLGLLNPGVKAEVPVKELAAELNAWCRLQA